MITWFRSLTKTIFLPHLSPWYSQPNCAKVMDFSTSLQAWCVFVRVYCRFHSHRVQEVSVIRQLWPNMGTNMYFHNFIYLIGSLGYVWWTTTFLRGIGLTLNRFLRTFRPVCFRWRNFGHYAQACTGVRWYIGSDSSTYIWCRISPRFRISYDVFIKAHVFSGS